jgi:hypothetical protein
MIAPEELHPGDVIRLSDRGIEEPSMFGGTRATWCFTVFAVSIAKGTVSLIPVGLRFSAMLHFSVTVLEGALRIPAATVLN